MHCEPRAIVLSQSFQSIPAKPFCFLLLLSLCLGCERKDPAVIDSIGSAPFLFNSAVSPATINTDTINIGSIRLPEDLLTMSIVVTTGVLTPGPTAIARVMYAVRREGASENLSSGEMFDNGVFPDAARNDTLYSAQATFQIVRSTVGRLIVEIHAEDIAGYQSNKSLLPVLIIRANQAPVLSNLQAPDTVQPSIQDAFIVTVKAIDPDGLADIRSVTRTTPSGNVWQLNDAGLNGDQTPNDGIFTERVSLNPPPQPGDYIFRFQAFDRSNAGSNIISHRVTVKP